MSLPQSHLASEVRVAIGGTKTIPNWNRPNVQAESGRKPVQIPVNPAPARRPWMPPPAGAQRVRPVDSPALQQARAWVEAVAVSVTLPKEKSLVETPQGNLVARSGTQLSASVDQTELRLVPNPPLSFRSKLGPTFEIERVRYELETARFHVDAKGPLDINSGILTLAANQFLRPLLPASMKRAGYDFRRDPDLVKNLETIARARASGLEARDLNNPQLIADIKVPKTSVTPIGGGNLLRLNAGDRFRITANLEGNLSKSKIGSVELTAHNPRGGGIHIARTDRPDLNLVSITHARIEHGGKVSAASTPLTEDIRNVITDIGSVATRGGGVKYRPPYVDTENRRKIDAALREVPQLIRKHFDRSIPGISLVEALGLKP
jgi:hypothetical protein